jgi:hypothetical protein
VASRGYGDAKHGYPGFLCLVSGVLEEHLQPRQCPFPSADLATAASSLRSATTARSFDSCVLRPSSRSATVGLTSRAPRKMPPTIAQLAMPMTAARARPTPPLTGMRPLIWSDAARLFVSSGRAARRGSSLQPLRSPSCVVRPTRRTRHEEARQVPGDSHDRITTGTRQNAEDGPLRARTARFVRMRRRSGRRLRREHRLVNVGGKLVHLFADGGELFVAFRSLFFELSYKQVA